MLRGEVWWTTFPAAAGGEVKKKRPAIIVSNDIANRYANRVQVVPLSSNIDKFYPCDAKVSVAGQASKAMADQVTTVTKERLTERMGVLSAADMHGVDFALRVQLGLAV
jgi:mRNA interferase MazF